MSSSQCMAVASIFVAYYQLLGRSSTNEKCEQVLACAVWLKCQKLATRTTKNSFVAMDCFRTSKKLLCRFSEFGFHFLVVLDVAETCDSVFLKLIMFTIFVSTAQRRL